MKRRFIFLIFAYFYSITFVNMFQLEDDRADWIDPTDMFNFDMSSGQMKYPKKNSKETVYTDEHEADNQNSQESGSPKIEPSLTVTTLIHNLEICKKELSNLQKNYKNLEEQLESKPVSNVPYFKQYVRSVLEKIPDAYSQLVMQDKVAYRLTVLFSNEDLNTLQEFSLKKDGNIQDAHQVMVNMIQGVELHPSYQPETWATWMGDIIKSNISIMLQLSGVFALCSIGIWIQVNMKLSWFSLSYKLVILLFMVSVPWNWWHLYKVELANRQAEALKDMPSECTPQDQTMWEIFTSAFSIHVDKCARYHEKMMVDPVWEVAPTRAIAVTVTKFCLEPLEHIGRALGKFIQAPLEELPVFLWPYVLTFVTVVFLLSLIMGFGYRIKLLYFFGLEPDYQRKQLKGIDELHKEMITLTSQVETLATTTERTRIEGTQKIEYVEQRLLAVSGPDHRRALQLETLGSHTGVDYVDSREVSKVSFVNSKEAGQKKYEDYTKVQEIKKHERYTLPEHSNSSQFCTSELPVEADYRPSKSKPQFNQRITNVPTALSITLQEDSDMKESITDVKPVVCKEDLSSHISNKNKPERKIEQLRSISNIELLQSNGPDPYDTLSNGTYQTETKLTNFQDHKSASNDKEKKVELKSNCSSNITTEGPDGTQCRDKNGSGDAVVDSYNVEESSSTGSGDKESDNHSNAESFEVIADSDSEEAEERKLSITGIEDIGFLS